MIKWRIALYYPYPSNVHHLKQNYSCLYISMVSVLSRYLIHVYNSPYSSLGYWLIPKYLGWENISARKKNGNIFMAWASATRLFQWKISPLYVVKNRIGMVKLPKIYSVRWFVQCLITESRCQALSGAGEQALTTSSSLSFLSLGPPQEMERETAAYGKWRIVKPRGRGFS